MYIYNTGNYNTAGQLAYAYNGATGNLDYCPYCSHLPYSMVYHYGVCPKIKEIEYYKDGAVKRVILR